MFPFALPGNQTSIQRVTNFIVRKPSLDPLEDKKGQIFLVLHYVIQVTLHYLTSPRDSFSARRKFRARLIMLPPRSSRRSRGCSLTILNCSSTKSDPQHWIKRALLLNNSRSNLKSRLDPTLLILIHIFTKFTRGQQED